MSEKEFLNQFVFYNLKDLNDGFDKSKMKYFSLSDFKAVLKRAEKMKILVHEIEPWKDGRRYKMYTPDYFKREVSDADWPGLALQDCIDSGEDLIFTASFEVPDYLL